MATQGKRTCMTCGRSFANGDEAVFQELAAFDDVCICRDCVAVYRKEVAPDPSARE